MNPTQAEREFRQFLLSVMSKTRSSLRMESGTGTLRSDFEARLKLLKLTVTRSGDGERQGGKA